MTSSQLCTVKSPERHLSVKWRKEKERWSKREAQTIVISALHWRYELLKHTENIWLHLSSCLHDHTYWVSHFTLMSTQHGWGQAPALLCAIIAGQRGCLLMWGCSGNTNEHSMPHHGQRAQYHARGKKIENTGSTSEAIADINFFPFHSAQLIILLAPFLKFSNVTEMFPPSPLCSSSRPSAADILWIPFSVISD